jgi:murein L,D-transpeptidase YcbB/YkuD
MLCRICLILAVVAALARADTRQDLLDLFTSMASALSEENPAAFLRAIDPSMPGYQQFADNVNALAAQNAVSSSIEIIKQEGDDRVQNVELDWLLEITGKDQNHAVLHRQSVVKCRLERRKNTWRVVSLDPASFFAPPGAVGAK